MSTRPLPPRSAPDVVAVGCDVVSVQRIAEKLARRDGFRSRVFTPRELADARRGGVEEGTVREHERLAARFAAKEAARKALGELSLGFHDTEVRTEPWGAPTLYVRGRRSDLELSLSHDGGVAFAVVAGLTTQRPTTQRPTTPQGA